MPHEIISILDKPGALDRALRAREAGKRVLNFSRIAGGRWQIKVSL